MIKPLANSEWLIVKPALLSLADYLRRQIDVAAEFAETDTGWNLVSALNYECVHLLDTRDYFRQVARPNFVRKVFREVYEALRECGRSREASEILRLYGNGSEKAPQTLQYVEKLLIDLDPEEPEDDVPSGTEIERLQQLLTVLFESAPSTKVAESLKAEIEELRRAIDELARNVRTVKQPLDGRTPESPSDPTDREVEKSKWLAQAMLLVQRHPDWPDARIARSVGKHPSTLSRNEIYQAAAAMARGNKGDLPRGYIKKDEDHPERPPSLEIVCHRDLTPESKWAIENDSKGSLDY